MHTIFTCQEYLNTIVIFTFLRLENPPATFVKKTTTHEQTNRFKYRETCTQKLQNNPHENIKGFTLRHTKPLLLHLIGTICGLHSPVVKPQSLYSKNQLTLQCKFKQYQAFYQFKHYKKSKVKGKATSQNKIF